jgi:hypothetical protein
MKQNPYAVLGLHPSADTAAVKRTYRRLIRELHPDVNEDPDATAKAAEVIDAYRILGDPERRAAFENNLGNVLRGWTDLGHWNDPVLWFRSRIRWCAQCGRDIRLGPGARSPTGRIKRHDARYCSNACRQRAYRARKAAQRLLGGGR